MNKYHKGRNITGREREGGERKSVNVMRHASRLMKELLILQKHANIVEELITKKKLIKKRNIWFIQVITEETFITE